MRVGIGYDVHKFCENRPLVLGGVTVPFELGLLGHSDADVLIHAVMDALLGAACLGDIGRHFPDKDNSYLNVSSLVLLSRVCEMLFEKGYKIVNIDSVIVAQQPKLALFLPEMAENIKKICLTEFVNVKATTEEHLGFTGRMEGMAAKAVCLIEGLSY